MAFDAFLEIDGIEGESRDETHKGEIEIQSFSWGATQSGTFAAGGGSGSGKVSFQDLHFTTRVNKASPLLMLSCASGENIRQAVLSVRKSGGQAVEYLKIKLSDVLVSSYQNAGATEGDAPQDEIALNFAKIEFSYSPQTADGSAASPVVAGWDLKANKQV